MLVAFIVFLHLGRIVVVNVTILILDVVELVGAVIAGYFALLPRLGEFLTDNSTDTFDAG